MLLFENFGEINFLCKEYKINSYTINSDGSIDVNGNVDLRHKGLTKIPLKFNKVSGYFNCSFNKLISLENCPNTVFGWFDCSNNELSNLRYSPKEVGEYFDCSVNQLISLKDSTKKIGGSFYCYKNKLTTLEGSPKKINGTFDCSVNQLISLKGCPENIINDFDCSHNLLSSLEDYPKKFGGLYFCSNNKLTLLPNTNIDLDLVYYDNNPIYKIVKLFKSYEEFKQLLDDYNYIRGNKIIRVRFAEACLEAGIKIPNKIEGYVII